MDWRVVVLVVIAVILNLALLYDDGRVDMYTGFERTNNATVHEKTDVYLRTTQYIPYDAAGSNIEGWLYRPLSSRYTPTPIVVMAHGLGLIKDAGLEKFARIFAEQGFATLTFDHRNFGGSDGWPRHHIKITEQIVDWEKVLAYVTNNISGIDTKKIAVWGYSIESGNALSVASTSLPLLKKQNITVSALILNTPIADAFELVFDYHWRHISTKYFTGILLGLKDLLISYVKQHRYVPIAAAPEDTLMSAIHDHDWNQYIALVPPSPHGGWENKITASSLFQLILYRPAVYASTVEVPTLVVLAKKDNYASSESVRGLAAKIPSATLEEYDIGCFEIFSAHYDKVARDQVRFLQKTLYE